MAAGKKDTENSQSSRQDATLQRERGRRRGQENLAKGGREYFSLLGRISAQAKRRAGTLTAHCEMMSPKGVAKQRAAREAEIKARLDAEAEALGLPPLEL
jgi:xanthine dehydrogenase molybdopterin-binding subunit B